MLPEENDSYIVLSYLWIKIKQEFREKKEETVKVCNLWSHKIQEFERPAASFLGVYENTKRNNEGKAMIIHEGNRWNYGNTIYLYGKLLNWKVNTRKLY